MRRQVRVAVLLTGLLAITACGPTTPTASTAPPSPSGSPVILATPAPASLPPPSSATGTIAVDATLLDLLPPEVAGVDLTPDGATAFEIAADPTLAGSVTGVAVATAFGPMPPDAESDYVVVTLARLRPGVFGDAFFRDWRDTFDEAVCAQAGGTGGHAEADIAGHQTFITTCAGGIRTYHVHLPGSDAIISMQASGERRYGERVIEGLTE